MRQWVVILSVFSSSAFGADGRYFQLKMFDEQKIAAKDSSRWTLADWLAQKSKMRLADQWLALNRSETWFELNTGAAHNKYSFKTVDADGAVIKVGRDSQFYHLDTYISVLNLYGEYEKTSDARESWGGAAGLRLFGTSSQSTTLLGRYGWRKLNNLDTLETWENMFAEGELQLYIFDFFGISGRYRKIFPNKSNKGNSLEGDRTTAGAFLEFGPFRLYGNVYREPVKLVDSDGIVTKEQREGYEGGIKLHF